MARFTLSSRFSALGEAAARHWVWVILAWIVIIVVAGSQAKGLKQNLRGTAGQVRGGEAAEVERLLTSEFDTPYAQFLMVALERQGPKAYPVAPLNEAIAQRLKAEKWVTGVMAVPATDGDRAGLIVGIGAPNVQQTEKYVAPLRDVVADEVPETAHVTALVTGQAAANDDLSAFGSSEAERAEKTVLPFTFGALLLAFGAFGAAGLPLVAGVGAVTLALGLVALAAHFLPLSFYASNVVTMLGLGLGIDYALFVVARLRREARAGATPREAVVAAIRHTAPSIAASAATVMIGLVALAFVPADDYVGLGLGGAIVAFTSAAAGMTLLPALAAMMGRWVEFPQIVSRRLTGERQIARWESWARAVLRHKAIAFALGTALLLAMASPLLHLKLGQPDLSLMPRQAEAIRAVGIYERMGNGGLLLPYRLLVQAPEGQSLLTPKHLAALDAFTLSLRHDARVAQVVALADPDRPDAKRLKAASALLGPEGLRKRLPPEAGSLISRDGRTASYHVVLRNRMPFTEAQAYGLELGRTHWGEKVPGMDGFRVLVGGPWAFANEMLALSSRSFPWLCGFILLATWVMLYGLTRSVFLPAKAIVANLLTVAAAWGATYWLFQTPATAQVLGLAAPLPAVLPAIPLITFCVLFGLSMDYEVFLLAGVMEAHAEGADDEAAIARGVGASAAVITSGAAIMAIVFIGFALTSMVPIKLLGVSLAIGVTLDATVTRLLVVPALMGLAGRWNWWPQPSRHD